MSVIVKKYLFFGFHHIKMSNPMKSINTAAEKRGGGGGWGRQTLVDLLNKTKRR